MGDVVVGEVDQACVVDVEGCRIVGMLLCDDKYLQSRAFVYLPGFACMCACPVQLSLEGVALTG